MRPNMEVRIKCTGADSVSLEKLIQFQGNLKDLSKENYQKLKSQILEHGFVSPVHVWVNGGEYKILDGTQRTRALKAMKAEGIDVPEKIPVNWVEAENEEQARKIILSLVSQYGTTTSDGLYEFMSDISTDPEYVRDILAGLEIPNIDTDTFFAEHYDIVPVAPGCDEDHVPEVKESISNPGDLWRLGRHFLLNGDSTNIQHIERLMGGNKADMVFTDPPYGVSYEKKCQEIFGQTEIKREIKNDDVSLDELTDVLRAAFHNVDAVLADKSSYYVCSPQGGELGLMMMMMQEANLICRHMIIWVKNAPVFSMGRLDYDYKHEPILFGWSKNRTHYKSTQQGQFNSSVWDVSREPNKIHPTMKPTALIENALINSCPKGGRVLDVFCGSGSTIIAAEKTGRIGYGCELDSHYVDCSIKRFEEFTGTKAELVGQDGYGFRLISSAR
jgi:DNA modification methylase